MEQIESGMLITQAIRILESRIDRLKKKQLYANMILFMVFVLAVFALFESIGR